MNPLFQVSKAEISERQMFSQHTFADNQILAALESNKLGGSIKKIALDFMSALMPLWRAYRKDSYRSVFEKFIEMETGLETLSDHSSHANHVLQVFLFGYNIITKSSFLRASYHYDLGRLNLDSSFGEVFFSWMAASLFHDVGYDIEKAVEEEAFRQQKNEFWDFMTPRSITPSSLGFIPGGPAQSMIQDYLLHDIKKIPEAPQFTYVDFENMFLRKAPNNGKWTVYDHGVISAVKYLIELDKLEKERGGNYLNWEANRRAALAMALHNFRYKDSNISLSFNNPDTLIAYLLIVCDEIQEWERERHDADIEVKGEAGSGKNAKRLTELVGVTFKDNYTYVILNHKLRDISLKDSFEVYMDKRLALMKEHYPILILYPQLIEKIKMSPLKVADAPTGTIQPVIGSTTDGLIEVTKENIEHLDISEHRIESLNEIASSVTKKNLLVPSGQYNIYVHHQIEGEPYITVVFQL